MINVELLAYTPEPERLIARAAKLCYSKSNISDITANMSDEDVEKFIGKLADMGHMSPFEHATFTFGIEGVSRSCTHQLVRHRIASYSQQSQRYVDMDEVGLVKPHIYDCEDGEIIFSPMEVATKQMYKILKANTLVMLMMESVEDFNVGDFIKVDVEPTLEETLEIEKRIKEAYPKETKALEKKVLENARAILPNATETKIIVTMNARSLMNFFKLRCCSRAQDEIRELANIMLDKCKEVAPMLFKNAGPECLRTKCPEGAMTCGNPWTKIKK